MSNLNEMSQEDKIKAAYALNLCTVSVSQIVDYDDINVLEQEYEAILNNLNLEHMPHDEALLNILKQLLDTITFFRIQTGDKEMLERRYKERMRNAIWNAVPNFGLIVAGGNPVTIAISLASQIGIGYMNYRKTKASNEIDRGEQLWQLQRTAMEQFNGLQRELFDTAWRLADRYGFEDEMRLTEKQIKHYDAILLDSNALRRYDRLDSIKDNFCAYPPFWYFLGNTANEIARDEALELSVESKQYYREKARECFEHYWETNKYPLLREDQLASSCALEYVDILIENAANKSLIKSYIDKATDFSGSSWDILQLCAIAYMRIEDYESAIRAFRILVNESYNTSLNSQILSGLLIKEFTNTGSSASKAQYEILKGRVSNEAYLVPWPEENKDITAELYSQQQEMLVSRYKQMIRSFEEKCTVSFNRILPGPDADLQDYWYSDQNQDNRIAEMRRLLATEEDRWHYNSAILRINYMEEVLNQYNEIVDALERLSLIEDTSSVIEVIRKELNSKADRIKAIQDAISSNVFSIETYKATQTFTSGESRRELFAEIIEQLESKARELDDMSEISLATSEIEDFCKEHNLPIPDSGKELFDETEKKSVRVEYVSFDVFGEEAEVISKKFETKARIQEFVEKNIKPIISANSKMQIIMPSADMNENKRFEEYFDKLPLVGHYKDDAVAIIDDMSMFGGADLILANDYAVYVLNNSQRAICSYADLVYDKKYKSIILGESSEHYMGDQINCEALCKELKELGHIAKEV